MLRLKRGGKQIFVLCLARTPCRGYLSAPCAPLYPLLMPRYVSRSFTRVQVASGAPNSARAYCAADGVCFCSICA